MGPMALPPGFRFHPTDEELVGYYLKRKVDGLKVELEVIPEIELYKFDPWQLPDKSFLPKRDLEWCFLCPRDRKYRNGSRTNRATRSGYWKATGKDRQVACHGSITGLKKTLVFYLGRAPLGDRTDWVMHEYLLYDSSTQRSSFVESPFALCRIVKRSDQGQKIGDKTAVKKSLSSTMCDHNSVRIVSEVQGRAITEKRLTETYSVEVGSDTNSKTSNIYISELKCDIETMGTPKADTDSSDLRYNSLKVEHQLKDEFNKSQSPIWASTDAIGVPTFSPVLCAYSRQIGAMTPYSIEINHPYSFEYDDFPYQSFEIPEEHNNTAYGLTGFNREMLY